MTKEKNTNQLPKGWELLRNGKIWQLFGDKTDEIINELNEVLTA